MNEPKGQIILYQTEDQQTRVQVRLDGETVWLSQRQMAELFQITVPTVNHHIKSVYDEGELTTEATIRRYLIVQTEAAREVTREIEFYNLDVIISVGYRVKSQRGTQFRIWATQRLREYIVKGFVMDDERLKDGQGPDYFDELIERIRDIRASERRFYQKITDIYARCSIDYDATAPVTQQFFATVQNKLHWAIHGHTAAETIAERADANKPNMGLTSWKGERVRKSDVGVAKNYLMQDELAALNRIVTMYLDYAEDQARQRKAMHMADWIKKLDGFLAFNDRNILTHAGKISSELAEQQALKEFEKYEATQRQLEATSPSSDFDKSIEAMDLKRLSSRPKRKKSSDSGPADSPQ
jgi:hypothetical protein